MTPTPKTAPEDHAVAVSLETERLAFEADYVAVMKTRRPIWIDSYGRYQWPETQSAFELWKAARASQPLSGKQSDPTDPGFDVDVLREQVRHLERQIRQLSAQRQSDSGQQREEPAICGESPVPIDADLVGCGEPIWTEAEVYRCTDCGVPFHRACAIRHFATDTPEHAQEVFAEQLRRLESASPVAMPEEGKAVASHAEEVQERASADLAEELRDMADEIASENWGASWSFQQYAVVMRDAAAALEAAPSQSETRQPCIGKNPSCPCQDGDACHYRDAADGTKGWPIPPAPDVLAMAEEALKHARQFIKNGVEYGYILMPDPDTPDSAHDTLPRIEAALARLATHTQEGGQIK